MLLLQHRQSPLHSPTPARQLTNRPDDTIKPMLGLAVAGIVIVALVVASVVSRRNGTNSGGAGSGFLSTTTSDSRERTNDSTEASRIRAHLEAASRTELLRLDQLEHKWRLPHDSATHARAMTAVLDSAEGLLRSSSPGRAVEARAPLMLIEQPLTPSQRTRRERLEERVATQAREAARAAADAAERAADAQKWSYSASEDPMTGRTSRMATIQSENTVSFGFPYNGSQHATLVIRNHPSYGRDVLLQIEQGQILCPSYDSCTVRIRFDNGAPERWTAVGPSDNSSTTVFIRGSSRFVQKLRSAKVVRIAIPVYQEGEPSFEFRVGGFDYQRYSTGS